MVIVDRLTKKVYFIPTTQQITSEGAARLYADNVFKEHGLSRKIICDRGTQFNSKFMKALFKILRIASNMSTAYHPQTDGQTERMNQELEKYLRIYINYRQDDWADWLSIAQFAYNDKIHSSTGQTPFFLNNGQHPWKGTEPRRTSQNPRANDFGKTMDQIREEASSALKHAADSMKEFYDRGRSEAREYQIRDKVYVEAINIKSK
ncbi:hypothetical protein MPER_12650 [Moniliophthora perniciosa FA553]|nr:hypothetical protein MPER_12650 [Moniliophthora perniciosa FA553]